jgi:hypothetical protein
MWDLTAYGTNNMTKISPLEGELVRDYCMRVMVETRKLTIPSNFIRDNGNFYEVTTRSSHSDEIEEWIFENGRDGAYYCTNIFGDGPCTWFFNDAHTAAMFKLAYGD